MKTLILSIVFFFCVGASCQTNTFPLSGNVGIGTLTPSEKIHVKGLGFFDIFESTLPAPSPNTAGIILNPFYGSIELGSSINTYSYIDFKGKNNLTLDFFGRLQYDDVAGFTFHNFISGMGVSQISMIIKNNGRVGIGTQNPDEKLTVKGKIHAEEVKIDLSVPADYVFQKYYKGFSKLNPDYEMLPLEEIESFLQANHHLPGLPSATEIQENGLELGKMNNLLLEKIEELTLYIIEQDKRIRALEAKIQNGEQD